MSNQFLGQGPQGGGLDDFLPASDARYDEPAPTGIRRFLTARTIAAALGLVALVEAFVIVSLLTRTPAAPAVPEGVQLRIESPQLGDVVMMDGREVGVTPLELNVGSSTHTISVMSRVAPPPAPEAAAPVDPGPEQSAAIALAAARQRSGGLRLVTPIEVQVLEGERVLGSSADGPIVTTAGVHQLDFVNTALGYRSRQSVEIRRGEIVSLRIEPPDGRVSINALPWAQVSIDGKPLGETPLANVPLPVGAHEIVFRHPQLGERRESIVVKAGAEMRVSATFGR